MVIWILSIVEKFKTVSDCITASSEPFRFTQNLIQSLAL
jgi:hypothetical protein